MSSNPLIVYGCDLGFDWNSPGSLQYGLMNKNENNAPAWFTKLPAFDSFLLSFDLYDLTSLDGSSPVDVQTLSFQLAFTDIETHAPAAPLTPVSAYNWNPGAPPNVGSGPSAVFPGPSLRRYPIGAVAGIADSKQQFLGLMNGNFNFTISICVTVGGTPQIFSIDPEMIVGAGNGPGTGDDDGHKLPHPPPQPERLATSL